MIRKRQSVLIQIFFRLHHRILQRLGLIRWKLLFAESSSAESILNSSVLLHKFYLFLIFEFLQLFICIFNIVLISFIYYFGFNIKYAVCFLDWLLFKPSYLWLTRIWELRVPLHWALFLISEVVKVSFEPFLLKNLII